MIFDSNVCSVCGSGACSATGSTHCRHTGKKREIVDPRNNGKMREIPSKIRYRYCAGTTQRMVIIK